METRKILIVDDEARMRKLVKDFLLIKGFGVLEAADGEQAVDIFFKDKEITGLRRFTQKRMLLNKKVSEPNFNVYNAADMPKKYVKK